MHVNFKQRYRIKALNNNVIVAYCTEYRFEHTLQKKIVVKKLREVHLLSTRSKR